MMYKYDKIHLLILRYRVKSTVQSNRISPETYKKLKDMRLFRHTRRGKKTSNKRNFGVNFSNLIDVNNNLPIHNANNHEIQTHSINDYLYRSRSKTSSSTVNFFNLIKIKPDNQVLSRKKHLTIGNCNAQSVRNKSADIISSIVDNNIDICVITETFLKDYDNVTRNDITPLSYNFLDITRNNRPGGGIGLLFRDNFKLRISNSGTENSFEYVEWTFNSLNKSFLLVAIYRPPYSHNHPVTVNEFLEQFTTYLENIITTTHILIITGDFNIHVDNKNDNTSRKFSDILDTFSLINHINFQTHIHGHTLDLFITRNENEPFINNIKPLNYISDHRLFSVSLTTDISNTTTKIISYRRIKNINTNDLKSDILNSSINSDSFENLSVSDATKLYNGTLKNILDNHAPLINKTIKIKTSSPWYSNTSRQAKREKRHYETLWIKNPTEYNKYLFNIKRTEYITKCNQRKTEYYSNKIIECGNDQRKLYNIISSLSDVNKDNAFPVAKDTQTLTNNFGNFFTDKIKKINERIETLKINENIEESTTEYNHNLNDFSPLLKFKEISEDDTHKIIKSAKSTTCNLDPIPTHILKQCSDELIKPIKSIINKSFSEAAFPLEWKCASVIPLLKKSNLENIFKNYRPVSNLSFTSKLVEKAALNQLIPHLESTKVYAVNNSAYKKYHSTDTLLTKIHSNIINNIDNQKLTLLVLLDLSAAFDTINIDKLINTLNNHFNVKHNALHWITSYLTERKQRIYIKNAISDIFHLNQGVPQGSCLGPIAFLTYISTLYDIIKDYLPSVDSFADDTQLHLSFGPENTDVQNAKIEIEKCIDAIRKWMLTNNLLINDSKTEVIIIGNKKILNKLNNINIRVGNSYITPSKSVRNLGIIFDDNFSFNPQINAVCKKAHFQLHKIRQLRKYLSPFATTALVNSLVSSNLDYCNQLYYGLPKYQIKKLQLIQNTAARLIKKLNKHDHITSTLKSLHWLPIQSRIIYKIALLTYKTLNNLAPTYLQDLLDDYSSVRTLRSSSKLLLKKPRTKTNTGIRSFQYSAPEIWNSLPLSARQSESVVIFRKRLKTHLFSLAYDN